VTSGATLLSLSDVMAAAARIRRWIRRTPMIGAPELDRRLGCRVLLKCENYQVGGAFKARGACNAVFSLSDEQAAAGVATHSSGNHAAALARAARLRGIPAHVVMPAGAAIPKRAAAEAWGARVIECEPTMAGRMAGLAQVVEETGARIVHPYEDRTVMAGQGTVALECLEQAGAVGSLVVPLGGGGLISGIASVMAERFPQTAVIGVEPAGADDALRSLRAGRVVPVTPDTVADGLRATVGEPNLAHIRERVRDIVTVADADIIAAMRLIWETTGMRVEPSGAVGVAALMAGALEGEEDPMVIVITGGNVDHGAWAFWADEPAAGNGGR
jgi:threonine dehydratase